MKVIINKGLAFVALKTNVKSPMNWNILTNRGKQTGECQTSARLRHIYGLEDIIGSELTT